MAMICFSKFSKWTRKAALITPEWLTTGETLLKTPIWMMLRSKLFPNFHLLSQKKSKLWQKKRKVAPSVLLRKSHQRKYISWPMRLSDLFKFFQNITGRRERRGKGRGKIWVKSVKFCLYSTKTRCYSGVQQAHPMKSTENLDFNLQKAPIFSSKARVTREDLKRYWTTDRGKFFNQNCLRLLSRRF